jgi:alkanesulfonate monooxygenase SsuD/methylene tetrahydromethanopterin reductase-like flavin-dependent oxidoreductase (luciferase family)
VARTQARAEAEFEQAMTWYFETRQNRVMFGYPGQQHPYTWYLEHGFVLLGSPGQVADRIGAYSEATGMKNFLCWFNVGGQPQAQVLTAMQRFAEEAVPLLDRRPLTARRA